MVICLGRVADLHMAQLMPLPLTVSCFSKIQIGSGTGSHGTGNSDSQEGHKTDVCARSFINEVRLTTRPNELKKAMSTNVFIVRFNSWLDLVLIRLSWNPTHAQCSQMAS